MLYDSRGEIVWDSSGPASDDLDESTRATSTDAVMAGLDNLLQAAARLGDAVHVHSDSDLLINALMGDAAFEDGDKHQMHLARMSEAAKAAALEVSATAIDGEANHEAKARANEAVEAVMSQLRDAGDPRLDVLSCDVSSLASNSHLVLVAGGYDEEISQGGYAFRLFDPQMKVICDDSGSQAVRSLNEAVHGATLNGIRAAAGAGATHVRVVVNHLLLVTHYSASPEKRPGFASHLIEYVERAETLGVIIEVIRMDKHDKHYETFDMLKAAAVTASERRVARKVSDFIL